MRFIRKYPLLFGWLLFYVITHLLTLLIALPFRGKDFQDLSALIGFVLVLLAFYILIGFLSFVVSIKSVAIQSKQVKPSIYLLKWLNYLYHLVLFCTPLFCRLTVAPSIEDIFRFVWQIVASFFAYRLVVVEWIKETTIHEEQDDGKQVVTV